MSTPVDAYPDVYESLLDTDTEDALFRDFANVAGGTEVSVKLAATRRTEIQHVFSLHDARNALHEGTVRALQVRYRHDGLLWIDTLLRVDGQTKLIRTATPM